MKTVMTVTLDLKPDVEVRLAAQAREKGVPLDAYLQSVIEDLARTDSTSPARPEEIRVSLDALAAMGKGLPRLSSSALTRESIYREHD